MKRFTIPCDFGGTKSPFDLYIGEPLPGYHPLHFQAAWLKEMRGGAIPEEVMESFAKLRKIAIENNVSFEELCMYALGSAAEEGKQDQTRDGDNPGEGASNQPAIED